MAEINNQPSSENNNSPQLPNSPQQPPRENITVEIVKTLVLSAILALGIRTLVAEARYIPSKSMVPTLQVDDRLIVDKVSYRFKQPERGDIVVFEPPDEAAVICTQPRVQPTQPVQQPKQSKDAYIKRIVGLPGEKVEIKQGQVYINDRAISEDYLNEAPEYPWGPRVVPQESYLVLGDNRNNSCDSHYWGFVPRKNIIGRAIVRFWPLDRLGEITPEPRYK